jgi:hypothetical protein
MKLNDVRREDLAPLWPKGVSGQKSRELRAAMSLARLWRNQSKLQRAHELLAPV